MQKEMKLLLRAGECIIVERSFLNRENPGSIQIILYDDLCFALFVAAAYRIVRCEICQMWLLLFPAAVTVSE
jgi:hypothetical protein